MSQEDLYNRVLGSLYEAALSDARWPAAAGLIDAACGVKGNALAFAEGRSQQNVEAYFLRFCFRGQRREDWEREYLSNYWSRDERLPRLRQLPDGRLVHVRELYAGAEMKTSAMYNELMRRSDTQNSLYVRLDGPGRTHVVWGLGGPVETGGWRSDQARMIERLLPHVRQFVVVRHALAEAGAIGKSLAGLLNATGAGVIHLDRKGQIVAANDRAVEVLRKRDGLIDDGGALHAVEPADDAALKRLLKRALPLLGGHGGGGSMTVGRHFASARLVLHVSPVGGEPADTRTRGVAALALVVDPGRHPRIDRDLVGSALGLTPTESSVAVMLTTGCSLREIAVSMGRKENTVRWHLQQIFSKLRISRQADLVRLVLSIADVPG